MRSMHVGMYARVAGLAISFVHRRTVGIEVVSGSCASARAIPAHQPVSSHMCDGVGGTMVKLTNQRQDTSKHVS